MIRSIPRSAARAATSERLAGRAVTGSGNTGDKRVCRWATYAAISRSPYVRRLGTVLAVGNG